MFFSWEPVGVKDSRTRSGFPAPDEDQEALLEGDEEPDGAGLGDEVHGHGLDTQVPLSLLSSQAKNQRTEEKVLTGRTNQRREIGSGHVTSQENEPISAR